MICIISILNLFQLYRYKIYLSSSPAQENKLHPPFIFSFNLLITKFLKKKFETISSSTLTHISKNLKPILNPNFNL